MSRLQMPPGEEEPARDEEAERALARQAVAYLDQATRDLDRAADRLARLDFPINAVAVKETADIVSELATSIRRLTGTP